LDDLTKVTQVIGHALHFSAVISDGKIALLEEAELSIEAKSPGLVVPPELLLDAQPGEPRRVVANANGLHQFGRHGAKQPGAHNGVHAAPCRGSEDVVEEDVIVKRVAL